MMNRLKDMLAGLVAAHWLQHLAFWSLSLLVLVNVLKVSSEIQRIDLVYALIFHLPLVLVVYFNHSVLFPNLLARNRFVAYVLAVLLTIVTGAEFYLLLFEHWIDYLFPGYYFIAYYTFWDITLFFTIYLVLTTLVKLARGWFRLNQMEQEKTSNELKALRSQLNPHFLFNSLNNLYSLTRKKSDLAPEMIIKLSDVLRYVIYDADTNLIPLQKELDFLNKYIEIQKLRLESDFRLRTDIQGDPGQLQIAPLLFLPFVENAFKYGVLSSEKTNEMIIRWKIDQAKVDFFIQNDHAPADETDGEKPCGTGIANVRKRLELLYPGKHELDIQATEQLFTVQMKINLR
ncbi:MAG: histidine kinase [Prolixibacteraceae bacterium]